MKQVWRQQQSDMREEDSSSNDEGGAWWENEEGEGPAGGSGGVAGRDKSRRLGDFRAMVSGLAGARFRVGSRFIPVEALTYKDAADMSAEEYTRFYNLIVGERA